MDTVLIVSETLSDFDRMKDWFTVRDCRVKGVRSVIAAPKLLNSEKLQLIALCCRGDFNALFRFYEKLRTSELNADTPLIVLSDLASQAVIVRNVNLTNTRIFGISVTEENMQKILDQTLEK